VLELSISLLGAYLLGSVSFAFLFVRLLTGKDLRQEGTGNLGGRNVSRILGKRMAVVVILLDMGKGAAAVWLVRCAAGQATYTGFWAMAAVLLGHNYSVFMGMSGGKGLASGFGAMLVLNPLALLALIAVGVITISVTRDAYKASLAMVFAFAPVVAYRYPIDYATWLAAAFVSTIVFARHAKHLR